MILYAFVILMTVAAGLANRRALRQMEARLMERLDQAIGGVRINGHATAQRQVDRKAIWQRPAQVD